MLIDRLDTTEGPIEYSIEGQGAIVVIAHGGHMDCREQLVKKGLDRSKFRLLLPSRPGYGRTPLTEKNKTPEGTAALFLALLNKLGIHSIALIGISAGGLTALAFAAKYPNRVHKLILCAALTKKWFSETDIAYKTAKVLFHPRIERLTWKMYRLSLRAMPRLMTRQMFRTLSTYRPVRYTDEEMAEWKSVAESMRSRRGFANDLEQWIDQSQLTSIRCSTLILYSENDNQIHTSHARNAHEYIKNSQLHMFKNRWGHMIWIGDEYLPVLKILNAFLQK